jgi:type II secretory pathway pseudopilin PulG
MMITLMLAVTLMAIALLAVLPATRLQVQRDREEELQHRGTAYMRAIQHFYKKFNRYPTRVEELENTNNVHFLRKRYKDPVNRDAEGKEKDFKFLHQQDISLNNGPVLGQAPGQGLQGGPNNLGGQGQGQAFGGGLQNQNGLQSALGGLASQPGAATPTTTAESSDSGTNASPNAPGSSPGSSSGSSSSSGFNGPTFGGGPILGVASTSKEKTVRVFYQKNHYNDWLFIYIPQADRGGLLTGPVNPNAQPQANLNGGLPGQPGNPQAPGLTPTPGGPQNTPTPPPQIPAPTPPEQ